MLFLLSLLFSTLRYMRSKYYPLHRCAFGSPERMRASRWFGYSRATIAWGHGWHGDFPRAFMKSTLQTWRLQGKKRIKNGLVEPWEEVVLGMPRWFRRWKIHVFVCLWPDTMEVIGSFFSYSLSPERLFMWFTHLGLCVSSVWSFGPWPAMNSGTTSTHMSASSCCFARVVESCRACFRGCKGVLSSIFLPIIRILKV